jgi:hypothetical protein
MSDAGARQVVVVGDRVDAYAAYCMTNRDRDLYHVLLDPCWFCLVDSIEEERRTLSAAARKERAARRTARAELAAIEHHARGGT